MRLYELLVAHMNGNRGVVDMMTNISLMTIRTCTPRTSRRSVRWTTTGLGKRPHDLRHTAASLWMAAGVDIQDGVGVNPQWQWTGAGRVDTTGTALIPEIGQTIASARRRSLPRRSPSWPSQGLVHLNARGSQYIASHPLTKGSLCDSSWRCAAASAANRAVLF